MNHSTRSRVASLVLLFCCIPLANVARAQDQGPVEADASEVQAERDLTEAILARLERTPGAMLTQERDRYLAQREWRIGAEGGPGGAWIGWGEAAVSRNTDSNQWGKARLIAYEQAWLQARTAFVRFQRQEIATETVRRYLVDDSSIDPRTELLADRDKSIREKIMLLIESKLDRALRDEGVEVPRTLAEKRIAYERALTRVSTIRATGRLAGLRPVMSFEANDETGSYTIGVLAIASPELRSLAETLASGRGWMSRERAAGRSSVSEQVRSRGDDLVYDFGVRVLTDEHGERALVAFGQSAPSLEPGANSQILERQREAGLIQAEQAAAAALAQFVEETLNFTSQSEVGEVVQHYRATFDDGFEEEGELASFIDRLNEETRSRAKVDARGIVRVHEWITAHPATGQLLTGVVLAWSPSSEEAARAAGRLRPSRPEPAGSGRPRSEPEVRRGSDWEGAPTPPPTSSSSAADTCPRGVRRLGRGITRDAATTAALLEAVRSTQGLWIESDTRTNLVYEELVKDLEVAVRSQERLDQALRQRTQGFVESYEILAESQDREGRWEIELCAVLARFDPDNPRPAGDRKTIAVLPFRVGQSSFDIENGALAATEAARRLEGALTARLVAAGRFRVLDRSFSPELDAEIESLLREGHPPAELSKIGQRFGADYLLLGTLEDLALVAEPFTVALTGYRGVKRSAHVSADWRLINVATREVDSADGVRIALDDDSLAALRAEYAGALAHEPLLDLAAQSIVSGVLDRLVPIQVAAREGNSVFLNQSAPRITPGTTLIVYAQGIELRDPATGAVLGNTQREVARLRVLRTEPAFSVAEVIEGSAADIATGAVCRRARVQ